MYFVFHIFLSIFLVLLSLRIVNGTAKLGEEVIKIKCVGQKNLISPI